jgi:hypothetical protein
MLGYALNGSLPGDVVVAVGVILLDFMLPKSKMEFWLINGNLDPTAKANCST